MQHKITSKAPLLRDDGTLTSAGYATEPVLIYDRSKIRASKMRIKEWDYYYIGNNSHGIALTIADNGYMGLISASAIDFINPSEQTTSVMTVMPLGKMNLPASSASGNSAYKNSRVDFLFATDEGIRRLNCSMKNFSQGEDFYAEFTLSDLPGESMVIATPFAEKKTAFYYNQKINCMRAEGYAVIGETRIDFSKEDTFATLDWGRGVWTYNNTWYWASASGLLGETKFGFNLGYGFGDTSNASENMLFYNNRAHKLDQVTFRIPKNGNGEYDYLKPWNFTSSDGRFEMDFEPILDRHADMNLLVLASFQHQVFGRFTGTAVLDDGTAIRIENFLGFAERVTNRW